MEAAPQHQDQRPRISDNRRFLLWIVMLLAAAEFVVRGPVRFLLEPTNWSDLSQNYTASKLWLKGESPSNPRNFIALWKQETGSRLDFTDVRIRLAPPLGGLVIMAPIAAFPWKLAKVVWLTVLLIAFAGTVWALVMAGGFRRDQFRTLAFVTACLALAPFHTGIANGNPTILVVGFCAVAVWAARGRRDIVAGVLFGAACSLKPQLGAFLVLYYLVRRRWQLFGTAVASTAALNIVAALYLQFRGASWIQDYLQNAKGFVTANPIDDFSTANPSRFTLINLQVPFYSITGHASSANLLAIAAAGLLLCMWLYLVVRANEHGSDLLSLGAVSILALLPVYHRFYDAALLVVPLCWCMTSIKDRLGRTVRVALLLMSPFLVPGTAFLQQLSVSGRAPETVTHSWWWNCIAMPHETWALLLLSVVLLFGIKLWERSYTETEATPSV
jgi:hypothetical protein